MKEKYTRWDVSWTEADEANNKIFIDMFDGTIFEVNMYELSDEDKKGLDTKEDYLDDPEVFERIMEVAVEREE